MRGMLGRHAVGDGKGGGEGTAEGQQENGGDGSGEEIWGTAEHLWLVL